MWFLFAIFLTKFFAHQATGQKANSTNQNVHSALNSAQQKDDSWSLVYTFINFKLFFLLDEYVSFFFCFVLLSFMLSNSLLRFLSLYADNDATERNMQLTWNVLAIFLATEFRFSGFVTLIFFFCLPTKSAPLCIQYLSLVLVVVSFPFVVLVWENKRLFTLVSTQTASMHFGEQCWQTESSRTATHLLHYTNLQWQWHSFALLSR